MNYFKIVKDRDIKFFNMNFVDFLNNIDYQGEDFVYLDPPYLITFSEYNKLWNDESEANLLEILDILNEKHVKFAISNVTHYKGKINKRFLNWCKKYYLHNIKSNYISYHDNSIKSFNEVLITNYKVEKKVIEYELNFEKIVEFN